MESRIDRSKLASVIVFGMQKGRDRTKGGLQHLQTYGWRDSPLRKTMSNNRTTNGRWIIGEEQAAVAREAKVLKRVPSRGESKQINM
jgi:hypothetical protein